ncbi:hypothetical protein L202_07179 [Cryptococcus amylolentus CBS 6039]|uniref:RCC1-like domain-containing protein n=2 Tax=Cryptococcus amylolentus TaxID=104669 RepID=A0A1E3HEW6_9TREE|nr:hypothetical protein L202_07179 [Cryptococcus amylolentus CBS 6039]ODN74877.1 hypothetical protein L202_07179 [Cryptococcus amylolentus CBS 6039]ODO01771.1 hypothetical protein I350_06600 [Cryptococcus amylolentus CBS 6273]
MPPRRSTSRASSKPPSKAPSRAASAKPVSKAAPKAASKLDKVPEASVPVVNGNNKRRKVSDAHEPPAKKGRVSSAAGSKIKKVEEVNHIPAIPAVSEPHNALFVWGTGDQGQFGLGPDLLEEIARPKIHTWLEEQSEEGKLSRDGKPGGGLESVDCGGMHTLAIDEGGRVRSWGINDNAALGRVTVDVPDPSDPSKAIENEELETYPFVVETLEKEGFRAVQVAAGDSISVAISDKGELRAWGSFRSNDGVLGFDGVPGHPKFQFTPISLPALAKVQITQVSCGADHVLAVTTAGHVYVWGKGEENQLGRRIISRRRINGLEPERLGLRNIIHVATGIYHSFALDKDGVVYGWGLNTFKQTGVTDGDDMVVTPTPVDALRPENHNGSKVIQIEGGEHHSLFLFDNGEVWGCGRCDANELGLPSDHPAQEGIKERRQELQEYREEKVTQRQKKLDEILQKGDKADEDDKAKAEQELEEAKVALKLPPSGEYVPEPVRIAFPPIPESYEVVPEFPAWKDSKSEDNPIISISAGTRHNLAVSKSGHLYAWGLGNQGQLGLGSEEDAEVPSLVRSKLLRPYKSLTPSAGGQHCVVLGTKKPEDEQN